MDYNIKSIAYDILNLGERDFIIKYLLESENWYFGQNQNDSVPSMERLKEILSRHIGIAYNSILMVGSGKIGFSLSPHKPLKEFDDDSDIDIAIVSNRLFCNIWDEIRRASQNAFIPYYGEISNSIFKGYINEKKFCEIDSARTYWNQTIDKANKEIGENLRIYNTINYRIYRSWEDLEEYHLKGMSRLKGILKDMNYGNNVQ